MMDHKGLRANREYKDHREPPDLVELVMFQDHRVFKEILVLLYSLISQQILTFYG